MQRAQGGSHCDSTGPVSSSSPPRRRGCCVPGTGPAARRSLADALPGAETGAGAPRAACGHPATCTGKRAAAARLLAVSPPQHTHQAPRSPRGGARQRCARASKHGYLSAVLRCLARGQTSGPSTSPPQHSSPGARLFRLRAGASQVDPLDFLGICYFIGAAPGGAPPAAPHFPAASRSAMRFSTGAPPPACGLARRCSRRVRSSSHGRLRFS